MAEPTPADNTSSSTANHDGLGYGFLLRSVDAITNRWVTRFSLIAIPPLRPRGDAYASKQQFHRDIFVTTMLLLSIASAALFHFLDPAGVPVLLRVFAAFALYRALDLWITIIRTGVFFSFRGDIQINREPLWRVRRILVGVFFNYVEITMWYSLIYLYIALACPMEFKEPITELHQALNLSFSTITTVGYGVYAPNRMLANVFAYAQVLTGIILMATVVGTLAAILTSDSNPQPYKCADESRKLSWWIPILSFCATYLALYLLLRFVNCHRDPEIPGWPVF